MPRTLGIDPTSRDTMGWALVEAGALLAFGDVPLSASKDQSEIGLLRYQGNALGDLVVEHVPHAVAIERPIINSRASARYLQEAAATGDGAALVGRMTGAVSRSIDVGLAAGVLVHVCLQLSRPIVLVNPGAAKHFACQSVAAKKQTVREAARLRVYEMLYNQALQAGRAAPLVGKVKRPSEHAAAAIFIALVGDLERRRESLMAAA